MTTNSPAFFQQCLDKFLWLMRQLVFVGCETSLGIKKSIAWQMINEWRKSNLTYLKEEKVHINQYKLPGNKLHEPKNGILEESNLQWIEKWLYLKVNLVLHHGGPWIYLIVILYYIVGSNTHFHTKISFLSTLHLWDSLENQVMLKHQL